MKRDLDLPLVGAGPVTAWWRAAPLAAVALAVAVILLGFRQTVLSMVAIWIRSETFAHGFVVVPLCLWLAWRRRDTLATLVARPWWWGLGFVFGAGALWLVATAGNVQVLQQFALAFMLQAAIITIVGLRIARVLAFPLAFFLFAVPTGEFLLPTLIDRTADFTVAALRLSGVPVYREGNNFIVPTGWWSVIEACSGIRYLIASVMVGTIYAAVAYRSARRRAIFIAASIVVPIIANWIRAYMIVMIGHLSNNKLATGIDHVIYGWLFFGVVMLLLFWVASYWQEGEASPSVPDMQSSKPAGVSAIPSRRVYAAAFAAILTALVWQPVHAVVERGIGTAAPTIAPVSSASGWVATSTPFVDWKPRYAGYATELQQTFENGGQRVGLYIAYYRNQSKGHELVTSTNFLAKRGDWEWNELDSSSDSMVWKGRDIAVERADLSGRKGKVQVFRFYWIAGHVTSSDYAAKAWLAWSKMTGRGDDSALVAVYARPDDTNASSQWAARRFVADMSPAIERALVAARESGR